MWNGGISIFRFLPGMRSPSRSSVQNGCVCIGNDCLGSFFLHEYLGVFSTHRKSLEILESVARFNLGSDFERYIYCSWLFLKSSPNLFRSSTWIPRSRSEAPPAQNQTHRGQTCSWARRQRFLNHGQYSSNSALKGILLWGTHGTMYKDAQAVYCDIWYNTISYNVTSYDGCSRLDRTILIRDGFLEIVSKPCKNANPGFWRNSYDMRMWYVYTIWYDIHSMAQEKCWPSKTIRFASIVLQLRLKRDST